MAKQRVKFEKWLENLTKDKHQVFYTSSLQNQKRKALLTIKDGKLGYFDVSNASENHLKLIEGFQYPVSLRIKNYSPNTSGV